MQITTDGIVFSKIGNECLAEPRFEAFITSTDQHITIPCTGHNNNDYSRTRECSRTYPLPTSSSNHRPITPTFTQQPIPPRPGNHSWIPTRATCYMYKLNNTYFLFYRLDRSSKRHYQDDNLKRWTSGENGLLAVPSRLTTRRVAGTRLQASTTAGIGVEGSRVIQPSMDTRCDKFAACTCRARSWRDRTRPGRIRKWLFVWRATSAHEPIERWYAPRPRL